MEPNETNSEKRPLACEPSILSVAAGSAPSFEAWTEARGVWPRLTHEECFRAGWEAAVRKIRDEADAKAGSFDGYAWDSGAGSSGYDRACSDVVIYASSLLPNPEVRHGGANDGNL